MSCVDLAEKLAGFQIFFPHRKENKINPVNDDQLVKEEKNQISWMILLFAHKCFD